MKHIQVNFTNTHVLLSIVINFINTYWDLSRKTYGLTKDNI